MLLEYFEYGLSRNLNLLVIIGYVAFDFEANLVLNCRDQPTNPNLYFEGLILTLIT